MKSKKFTYLLMGCVAVVWGIICYRIYFVINEEEAPIVSGAVIKVPYFKMVNHEEDQVELDLNYHDPFLREQAFVEDKNTHITPVKPMLQIPFIPKQQANWTGLIYNGYINNPASKQKLAIFLINGKEVTLSEGQTSNGLKLLKHAGDSVKMQYQGETKYIRIK